VGEVASLLAVVAGRPGSRASRLPAEPADPAEDVVAADAAAVAAVAMAAAVVPLAPGTPPHQGTRVPGASATTLSLGRPARWVASPPNVSHVPPQLERQPSDRNSASFHP